MGLQPPNRPSGIRSEPERARRLQGVAGAGLTMSRKDPMMSNKQWLGPRSQAGQAIVLIAFMILVLFAAVGLAVDGGVGYYYNTAAERAAAAAALAGGIL